MSVTLDSIIASLNGGRTFSFSRWGDGEFAALFGDAGANCDGVKYAPDMVTELSAILRTPPNYIIGKQPYHANLYNPARIEQIEALGLQWANADLLHDASKAGKLKPFLKALDGHKVTIIGNPRLRKLDTFFDFDFVDVHGNDAWSQRHELLAQVPTSGVVLFAAGITSNWLIDKVHGKGATLIDIGSLLDPFVGDRTRNYHKGVDVRQAVPIHLTMATVPRRERFARTAIESLLNCNTKADTSHIELNGYTVAPDWLEDLPVTYTLRPDNIGAKAKLARLDGVKGYYLTVDDDIAYPRDYIGYLTDMIENYGRKAFVGFHGSTHKRTPIRSYWHDVAARYHFEAGLHQNTPCSMLGTGTLAFHTSIGLTYSVFEKGNQTDPYLSRWANNNRIAQIALCRAAGYIRQIAGSQDTGGEIWRSALGNDSEQTNVINDIRGYWLKFP
jgi:hypothetical protein